MDTTTEYLPDAVLVEVGSPAQENLRYALQVLERHAAGGLGAGEIDVCTNAISTLRSLTRPDLLADDA